MKRAISMLGAVAALAVGFLFAAPAAHAQVGPLAGTIPHGTAPNVVTCTPNTNALHTYPGDYSNSPTNDQTHFWLCGAETSYAGRFGLVFNAPGHLKTQLDTAGIHIYYFVDYDDAKIWIDAEYGAGALPTSAGNPGITGYSSSTHPFVVVYENYWTNESTPVYTPMSSGLIAGTTKHELGHMADRLNSRISETAYFKDLMQQDIDYYNSHYNFCTQLYPTLCSSSTTPIPPYNNTTLYPVATRNYKVLEEEFPRFFKPASAGSTEWHEVFAEEFARQSGNGTHASIDGFLSKFHCTMRYLDTYYSNGTGVAPVFNGAAAHCTAPTDPLP